MPGFNQWLSTVSALFNAQLHISYGILLWESYLSTLSEEEKSPESALEELEEKYTLSLSFSRASFSSSNLKKMHQLWFLGASKTFFAPLPSSICPPPAASPSWPASPQATCFFQKIIIFGQWIMSSGLDDPIPDQPHQMIWNWMSFLATHLFSASIRFLNSSSLMVRFGFQSHIYL